MSPQPVRGRSQWLTGFHLYTWTLAVLALLGALFLAAPAWLVGLTVFLAVAMGTFLLRVEARRTPDLPGRAYLFATVLVLIPSVRIAVDDDLDGPADPPLVAALLVVGYVLCLAMFESARRRSTRS